MKYFITIVLNNESQAALLRFFFFSETLNLPFILLILKTISMSNILIQVLIVGDRIRDAAHITPDPEHLKYHFIFNSAE